VRRRHTFDEKSTAEAQLLHELHPRDAKSLKDFEKMIEPWRVAVFRLRDQHVRHCLTQPPERRRFQNRRLFKNFNDAYTSLAAPGKNLLLSYWWFSGYSRENDVPYKEARQQHYAELKARGLPKEFDPGCPAKNRNDPIVKEFTFRLNSLASWIEAQESWIFWRGLCNRPAMWNRRDPKARKRAVAAGLIRGMRTIANELPDRMIMDFVKDFRKWSKSEWAQILKSAARDSDKVNEDDLRLERWVWWRYPIFSRYLWSTAEVCRAAREKFGRIHHVDHQESFQLFWIRRGLRFSGKRRKRNRPPLWDFVMNKEVPIKVSLAYPTFTPIPYGKEMSHS
jgi:hypothetical protein